MALFLSEQRLKSAAILRVSSGSPSPFVSTTPTQNTPSASCTAPKSYSTVSKKLVMGLSRESPTNIPWRGLRVLYRRSLSLRISLASRRKARSGGCKMRSVPCISMSIPFVQIERYHSSRCVEYSRLAWWVQGKIGVRWRILVSNHSCSFWTCIQIYNNSHKYAYRAALWRLRWAFLFFSYIWTLLWSSG